MGSNKIDNARWGDLPVVPDTESGIAAIEREQITKPRSMELEGPQLHQPSSVEYSAVYELPSERLFKDNIVTNTIKLIQHSKKLKAMVQSLQLQLESQKCSEAEAISQVYPPLPPMPVGLEDAREEVQLSKSTQKFSAVETDVKPELKLELVEEVDHHCVMLLLRKVVAIICAHVGFEVTSESVLRILADVMHEFFVKFCNLLRIATEKSNMGFGDVFEQAFYEMGLGSIKTLQTFHQTRIVNYYNRTLKQCRQLMADYEKLKQPGEQIEDVKIIKIKDENMEQIQFPISEEFEEIMEHGETVIHLEELHGLHNIEHVPTSGLGEDEVPKWSLGQGHKDLGIHNQTPTLDSDDEIIDVSDSPQEDNGMHVDLINIPTSLPELSPTNVSKIVKTKKK